MRLRGFEKVKKYQDIDFSLPARQTCRAAGYDFYLPETVELLPGKIVMVPTGVKAYMQADEFLGLHIRSSLAVKKGLRLVNNVGIVDADYYDNPDNEGHIMLALKNTGSTALQLKKGERIAQGIFSRFFCADGDENEDKEKRMGGFGSTK